MGSLERNPVSQTGAAAAGAAAVEPRPGKYLTFILGHEEYGLEILKVREIMGVVEIIGVPNAPSYVKGVINLRGTVIPVIDLRLKFGMPARDYDRETCIIVVTDRRRFTSILVDTVSEVLDIGEGDIDPAPEFGDGADANYILGIGKVKRQVKLLLDIEKVIAGKKLEVMPGVPAAASEA